jgi:hypothetical protein
MAPSVALSSSRLPILGTGRSRSTAQRCDPSTLARLTNLFTHRRECALAIGLWSGREGLSLL